MQVKPVSGMAPRPLITDFFSGRSERIKIVADQLNRVSQVDAASGPSELLLSLLNDTEMLSLFVRHAGVSEEVSAALLREVSSAATKGTRISTRSMNDIEEVLARIRPVKAGIEASYGAQVSLGEPGSNPAIPFIPFSPSAAGFTNAIDEIGMQGASGGSPKASIHPPWLSQSDFQAEEIRGFSGMAYFFFASAICMLAATFFASFM
jgi:hypothetical protein